MRGSEYHPEWNNNPRFLSYDDVSERESRLNNTLPVIQFVRGTQYGVFVGAHHVNDPNHPQFMRIRSLWDAWIDTSGPHIALVEGHFDEASSSDTADPAGAITQGGEGQYLVHLARRDGIQIVSPEPDFVSEAESLAEMSSPQVTLLYYILRYVNLWSGYEAMSDRAEAMTHALEALHAQLGWDARLFQLRALQDTHMELFGRHFDIADGAWADTVVTPFHDRFITNQLARRSGDLRDQALFHAISHHWRSGAQVFVVYGSSHAIRLEPALRQLEQDVPYPESSTET